ncbi:MAG: hypothetical protein ACLPWF_10910 [Bryobacteraceae bacterium]
MRLARRAYGHLHADAVGVEVGGTKHWVAISPERDEAPVAAIWVLYGGFAPNSWLVERGTDRGAAIDGRVLDAGI